MLFSKKIRANTAGKSLISRCTPQLPAVLPLASLGPRFSLSGSNQCAAVCTGALSKCSQHDCSSYRASRSGGKIPSGFFYARYRRCGGQASERGRSCAGSVVAADCSRREKQYSERLRFFSCTEGHLRFLCTFCGGKILPRMRAGKRRQSSEQEQREADKQGNDEYLLVSTSVRFFLDLSSKDIIKHCGIMSDECTTADRGCRRGARARTRHVSARAV